jgi:hypothetical protein
MMHQMKAGMSVVYSVDNLSFFYISLIKYPVARYGVLNSKNQKSTPQAAEAMTRRDLIQLKATCDGFIKQYSR